MKVFIMGGGGTLGSCIAFGIANRGIADEVVLYDIFPAGAKHHAFDIYEAVCLLNSTKVRAGTIDDMACSDIVVNAMGLPIDWTTVTPAENVIRLKNTLTEAAKNISALAPEAVVISVTNPLDPVNYYLWKCSGLPRERFIGCSLNDTLRLRKGVAAFKNKEAYQVEAFVVGGHDKTKVPLFDSVKICGAPMELTKEDKEHIERNMAEEWKAFLDLGVKRTAGWTTSVCVSKLAEAVAGKTDEIFPCSVIPPDDFIYNGLSIGLPVRLCKKGVSEIVFPDMSEEEKIKLDASAGSIKNVIEECRAFYGM